MKNPWPIVLTVFIIGAFVSATMVAVIMIRQKVDLVVPDYYEQDLRHSERMSQERRARGLERPLNIQFDTGTKILALTFPDPSVTGTIQLYRPSDSALDQTINVQPGDDGRQTISIAGLASGFWRVNIAWQFGNEVYYSSEALVLP